MTRSILIIASFLSFSFVLAGQIQVSEANPVVRKLTLSNVHAVTQPEQQRIVQHILNQIGTQSHGNKSDFFNEIAERIRFDFQRIGYFKVLVEDPVVKVIGNEANREIVDIDVRVEEGKQYHLKQIDFSHNTVSSSSELRSAFPIADGDIFDREKIGAGLEGLRQTYAEKGYVNFSAVPETELDEAVHSISLTIEVDEGNVFRWGTLMVQGVESQPGARDKLLRTWSSYEGKVFDPRLLQQFLRDVGARPSVKPEQILRISFDQQAKAASVSMTLVNPPSF